MFKNIFLILFTLNFFENIYVMGKRKAQGKLNYEFNFSGDYAGCDDPGEDMFNYTKLIITKDTPVTTVMSGAFDFKKDIQFGTNVHYKAFKITENGKELAWTMELPDFCEVVPQKEMPWSTAIDAMNLNPRSCPIPAGLYEIDPPLKLDMSFMKDTISKENVGEYEVLVKLFGVRGMPPQKTLLTCFTCGYQIEEVREQVD